MKRDWNFSQLTFSIASYEENIKTLPQISILK